MELIFRDRPDILDAPTPVDPVGLWQYSAVLAVRIREKTVIIPLNSFTLTVPLT
jgi:hypothetical protein